MKRLQIPLTSILFFLIMTSFSQCSGTYKLEKEAPFKIKQIYYQHWVAGIQGGGSGINFFIDMDEAEKASAVLDSVYFKTHIAKLEQSKNGYVAHFKTKLNEKQNDFRIDNTNTKRKETPQNPNIPFKLEDKECVISYTENNILKYFKFNDVIKKEALHYPMTKRDSQKIEKQ